MIETFKYITEIDGKEFQHTIHSQDIETSFPKWISLLEDLKNQVYSFDNNIVEQIRIEFDNQRIELLKDDKFSYLKYEINGKYQLTYINSVKKNPPDFTAELRFLATNEGGRKGYAVSGYRPHFQMEGKEEVTSAEQIFVDKDKVFPGDSVSTEVRILWTEAFEGVFYEGLNFKLAEGPIIVAEGVIKKVLNQKLKAIPK